MKKKHNDNAIKQSLMRRHSETKLIYTTYLVHRTLALYVLHHNFGFGKSRMDKFLERLDFLLDCYNDSKTGLEYKDIVQELIDAGMLPEQIK